jgi:hypothetical protein
MSPEVIEPPTDQHDELPVRRLSEDFREILREAAGRDVTMGELEHRLQGRGFALFILLLSVPFCFPIAIPWLSIPFGVVIMLLGIRISLGRKPQLPDFILNKVIKHRTLDKIVGLGLKFCLKMEKIAKPRMHFLRRHPGAVKLIGVGLASGGVQLLLPLPPLIPLSNTIPAVSVMLLTAGLIERDGVFVLAGYFVNIAAWVYFSLMFAVAGKGIEWAFNFLQHG